MFSFSHVSLGSSLTLQLLLHQHTGLLVLLQTPKAHPCPRAFAHALLHITLNLEAPSLGLDCCLNVRSFLTTLYNIISQSHSPSYPLIDFFHSLYYYLLEYVLHLQIKTKHRKAVPCLF